MTQTYPQACLAEFIGTFMLVFVGTGAIVVNEAYPGSLGHAAISLCFGLIVLSIIYAIGEVSGAHINPAVTLAFWLARRFPGAQVWGYLLAQCLGAILASLMVSLVFPPNITLGATLLTVGADGAVSPIAGLFLEFIMSWWLMTVILSVSQGAKEKGLVAGLVIGAVVSVEALLAGPMTGASMNPARSLGPALVSMNFTALWVYLVAPITGMAAAVYTCKLFQGDQCCNVHH